MVRLLSDNDIKYLSKAQQTGALVTLERRLRGYELIAKTIPASDIWGVGTIIQLREVQGNTIALQNFKSVEQMRKCKGW